MSGPELIIDLISSSSEGEEDSEVKFMGQVASSSQDKVRERESKDEKQNRKRRRTEPTPLRIVIDEIGQRDNAIITEIIESISSYCVKTPSKAGHLSLTCIGSSPKCRSTVEHIQQRHVELWLSKYANDAYRHITTFRTQPYLLPNSTKTDRSCVHTQHSTNSKCFGASLAERL